MDKSIFSNLEKSISPERLAAYKADGVSNEVALARNEEFLSDSSAVFGNYSTSFGAIRGRCLILPNRNELKIALTKLSNR